MCSLNPFSEDFRQQCVSGLAKAQLSNVGEGDKKVVVFVRNLSLMHLPKPGIRLRWRNLGWISPAESDAYA